MLVILAPESGDKEDLQVNQMALLADLVDLMFFSELSLLYHQDRLTRPPMRSRPSNIVTFRPCWASTSAHLSPETPAPTTQTMYI